MNKLTRIAIRTFDIFVFFSLLLMVVLVFVNAVMRYIFRSGFPLSEELSRYLFVWVSFLGAIIAYKENKHVGVTLLVDKLTGKSKKTVNFIANILVSFAMIIVFIGGVQYLMVGGATKSPASGLPFGVVIVSVMATSLFIGVTAMIKCIFIITSRVEEN